MDNLKNILALSMIKGVGSNFIKKNLPLIISYSNNLDMLSSIGGKVSLEKLLENIPKAEKIVQECKDLDITPISILSSNYPSKLLQLSTPPPILYCKGNLELLKKPLAIIGTRKSTELGNKIAYRVASYFSNKGYAICNGLVEGIDKAAIFNGENVLNNVIGVLSGGLNFNVTSSQTIKFLSELVLEKNGLLISENVPNKKEDQFSGSKASRIQAGLSLSLILVQSNIEGGSKYTIKAFSSLNRPLAVISYSGNKEYDKSEIFSGNRLLIQNKYEGIGEMCGIKKTNNIRISDIVELSKKIDYIELEQKIKSG